MILQRIFSLIFFHLAISFYSFMFELTVRLRLSTVQFILKTLIFHRPHICVQIIGIFEQVHLLHAISSQIFFLSAL